MLKKKISQLACCRPVLSLSPWSSLSLLAVLTALTTSSSFFRHDLLTQYRSFNPCGLLADRVNLYTGWCLGEHFAAALPPSPSCIIQTASILTTRQRNHRHHQPSFSSFSSSPAPSSSVFALALLFAPANSSSSPLEQSS